VGTVQHGNLKAGTHLGDINRDGKIILNWMKIHSAGGCGLDRVWTGQGVDWTGFGLDRLWTGQGVDCRE
jgi:hypothetical protein